MPRIADIATRNEFRKVSSLPDERSQRVQCRHCDVIMATNTSRQRHHLLVCKSFQEDLSKRPLRLQSRFARSIQRSSSSSLSQSTLNGTLSKEQSDRISRLAARAIIESNLPLSAFEGPAMKTLFQALNPAWKRPYRQLITETLLPVVYAETQAKVAAIIDVEKYLTITFDDSTDVNSKRITNISVKTSRGTFYIDNYKHGSERLSAARITTDLVPRFLAIANNKPERISAICSDTCSTMRDVWIRLKEVDQLGHILTIPCDSHGLNLLVKDLCLKIPEFSEAIKDGNSIVSHFKRASKQLAGLREIQLQRDGKTSPLALAAETRWGFHYNLITALLNNRSNLFEFSSRWDKDLQRSETSRYVKSILYNNDFWFTISELERLLKPINMAIIESQGERAHLGLVKERWLNLRQQLMTIERSSEGFNWSSIWQIFEERRRTQLCGIHDLAFRLMPYNTSLQWERHEKALCIQELLKLVPPGLADQARSGFLQYTARDEGFHASLDCWQQRLTPKEFWQWQSDICPPLTAVALRVIHSIANQCPSERAFSQMNLVQTKLRNRLNDESANMLLFIRINERALRQRETIDRRAAMAQDDRDREIAEEQEEQREQDVAAEDLLTSIMEEESAEQQSSIESTANPAAYLSLPPLLAYPQAHPQTQIGTQIGPQIGSYSQGSQAYWG